MSLCGKDMYEGSPKRTQAALALPCRPMLLCSDECLCHFLWGPHESNYPVCPLDPRMPIFIFFGVFSLKLLVFTIAETTSVCPVHLSCALIFPKRPQSTRILINHKSPRLSQGKLVQTMLCSRRREGLDFPVRIQDCNYN